MLTTMPLTLQQAQRAFVPVATPTEAVVARILEEVLGVQRVGATDDFFALGGHSLLATRVVARLAVVLGVNVPVRAVFDAPVVRSLAQKVEAADINEGHRRRRGHDRVAPRPRRAAAHGGQRDDLAQGRAARRR